MKGIILVGGLGSRLYPITKTTHKQLLPIYDKPMIYYALTTLMEANIKEVLIITTAEFEGSYKKLLGDGSQYGMRIEYDHETKSMGIACALWIAEEFIGNDDVCLLLGDNIFLGNYKKQLIEATQNVKEGKSTIFGYEVSDPERFGVVEFDKTGKVLSLEEKPVEPKSNYAATGLYFYTNDVLQKARQITPSKRGEYEITDVNKLYLSEEKLNAVHLNKDQVTWLDAGTIDSLLDSALIVKSLQETTGKLYGSPDICAYENGWINITKLLANAASIHQSDYSKKIIAYTKKSNTKSR